MSFEYFQDLSNDLKRLLTTEKDMMSLSTLVIKEFHAHSNILYGAMKILRFYSNNKILSYLSDDFLDKIYPLKELLPKDLADELKSLFCFFASWIDKKENLHYNNVRNIPYNFNLLYRASRDSNTPAEFHAKCDNKGATIVVVKIKISEQMADIIHFIGIQVDYGRNNPNYAPLFDSGWYLYNTIITSLVFGIVKNLEVIDGNIYYQALNQSLKAGEQFTIAANDIMTPTLLGPYSIEVAVVDQPSDPKNSYEVHACAITVVLP
ncbi:hypothetical protein GLOIN_2v1881269 [Rhizophagus irregularis DAOM 181602=DAOM 197198]|uniref:Uncharacterized protein n=1 Tax=Rhizophagus irregularis (strain DAOM 181602 / DAOM 197198 / MUCL 43194) TaxID=747089 RepID=A0A2P4PGP7_RHIID|nr:hypothetical protein GLOIN_2v1881269 [Rhizophagus irregularis DAOM 181602=DAOM 197198]POG64530.1 hypothetical protein GLOIN_2v1881269 [Rhizophagus irregularis DAOM 181602=DAOM 197198]|eukprot:XP_025171396.1 hypothetical protein GLOIN_2v1881269 [Rhizophagus irregularis DAOM 181602=DAOM 197198]